MIFDKARKDMAHVVIAVKKLYYSNRHSLLIGSAPHLVGAVLVIKYVDLPNQVNRYKPVQVPTALCPTVANAKSLADLVILLLLYL